MTSRELKTVIAFEQALSVGLPVRVCWTNSHNYYRAMATVIKVNKASVRVKLAAVVGGYPAGQEIRVPLFTPTTLMQGTWSCSNRVEPITGYPDVEK